MTTKINAGRELGFLISNLLFHGGVGCKIARHRELRRAALAKPVLLRLAALGVYDEPA